MDALTLLSADHNRVRGLFARFKTAKEQESTEDLAALGSAIVRELQVHAALEEQEIPGRSSMKHDELAATVAPPGAGLTARPPCRTRLAR